VLAQQIGRGEQIVNQERDILFEELVGRHIDLVFYVAKSWCHSASWAEDLAQESF
jgi:DNA-directed RNA polymerase specialized sigma24 family protein